MKKRRIAIVSFILVAVLTIGVGFAALAETLNISGTATFRPANVVNDRIDAAIAFTNATPDEVYCTSATFSGDAADMTVLINDTTDTADVYTASATYEVTYDGTAAGATTYPAVTIDIESTITAALGSTVSVDGFDIDVTYAYAENAKVAGKLSPGETMTVTVTVTYDESAAAGLTEVSAASIAVALHYDTEDIAVLPED